ncbi:MAG: hypothetical protein ACI4EN_03410 [Butyrivibrio sp.]
MNKKIKKVLKWILITAVILIAGFFYSFVRKDAVIVRETENAYCCKEADLVYTFKCRENMLAGIKLMFNSNEDNSGVISYVVQDEGGNNITDINTKKVSSLKKDKYTLLKFKRIDNSRDCTYRIIISCDRDKDKAVTLAGDSLVSYSYIQWDPETMVVFCIVVFYLVGLAKVLMWIFRK